jgi:hypothetical protein
MFNTNTLEINVTKLIAATILAAFIASVLA